MRAKPSNPRLRRRPGLPDYWAFLNRPGPTFAQDAGDIADLMRRTAAGVRSGGCNYTSGPRGRCLSFDGSTGYAATVFMPAYRDFTVALWFLCTSTPAPTARIIDCSYSASFWLGADGGGNPTAWGGGIMQAGPPYGTFVDLGSNGAWHHLVMTRAGTLQTIIIDGGKFAATATVSGSPLGGQAMTIGGAAGGSATFAGLIDDIRVYPYALTPADVARDYADPYRWFRPRRRVLAGYAASARVRPPLNLDNTMQFLVRQQGVPSYPLTFKLVSSADFTTPVVGATPTVTISKNGGAMAAPAGAVGEIGGGWYKIAPNKGDIDTLGSLLLSVSAAGAVVPPGMGDAYVVIATQALPFQG